MTPLSIIIVNYRSAQLIIDCLHSFHNPNFELIVVDNDNDPTAETQIRSIFPSIRWISMHNNAGFARANNEGIRQATADTVLLLNPDILVEHDAIAKCFQRFANSNHIACGVQLLNPDRTPQISGSYFITGGINHLLPLPFTGQLVKWMGNALKVKKTSVEEAGAELEVDWINGAFLMVKKSAIARAGLLDEDFFLYAEEIEWCARLRKYGSLCIYGDLHVVHLQGQSANESFNSTGQGYYNLYDRKGRQLMLSNFVRIRKQFGAGWFFIHLLCYLGTIPVFLLGQFFQPLFGKRRYSWKQFRGFVRNVLYVTRISPTIARNRPHFYKA